MKVFAFQKTSKLYVILILILMLAGIGMTAYFNGFRFGIEFNPGATASLRIGGSSTVASVEEVLSEKYPSARVQALGRLGDYLLRISTEGAENVQEELATDIVPLLQESFASVTILESAYVGPVYSRNFQAQTGILIAVALILMLAYLWFRFQFNFAIASIITLIFHDALLVIVFVGATQIEITAATVAAMLTVLGYSLNDTIVVFDRIRENLVLIKNAPLKRIVNTSITQSLNRTIITSVTTLLASIALVVFAQGGVRNFAIVLSFGVLSGTFSSIFIASPIFLALERRRRGEKTDQSVKSAPHPAKPDSNAGTDATESVEEDDINLQQLREELGRTKRRAKKSKK